MSEPSSGYPNPFTAYTFPSSFISNSDINLATWNYRLLRSLQVCHTNLPLVHQPYYRLFSSLWEGYIRPPFLIATDHHFEWRSSIHSYPICVVLISINPLFRFSSPCHAPDIFRLFFFLFFPLLQDVKTFSSDYDHQNIQTPLFIADLE